MKNTLLSILFLTILALAACAAPIAPAPTPMPVESPAVESPTAEAPDVPAPVPPPTDELVMLRANPWLWVSFTSPTETFEVETPGNYTVTFNTDASLAIVADCNNAAGSYQGEGGKLTVDVGPMTAAACPPESRSDQFVKLLSNGALYFFQDGNLHIDLAADGGTMVFAPATASAVAFGDAWESVACDVLGVGPEVAAVADCGYVTVPENRAAGTEDTIRLAVVRVKSVSDTPGAPLMLGTGGPGGPGLQDVQGAQGPGFLAANGPILEDRDFVLFSQRGTALAEPTLDCPAFSALTIQASMEGMSLEARGQAGRDALVKCAEAFAAEGVDLSAYNSDENADDVDAIRQALGYDRIFYYGESYGTQLGQFVLRRHPDILEGIMLDGVVPVTKEQSVRVSDIPGAFQTVFAACAADEACNAAYPDLEAMLVETMDRLRENPVSYTLALPGQEPVEVKVDDLLAMNALFIDLYLPGGYAKLPELVKQLYEGNMAPMRATLPILLQTSSFARVMHYAINCTDDPTTSLDDLALDGVAEVYARLVTDDGQSYANICPALDLPQLPADSDALVESDIPALLLQGGLDPATPRSGGLNVAEGLPNSTEVLVSGGTHVQFGNPCVVNIVRDFMRDPAAEVDLSCIDPTVAFKLPAPVTSVGPGASNAISITLPPTFMTAAPGQWSDNEMVVITASFPATRTVEAVLGETAAALQLQNPEVVAGPTIAGMESAFVQAPPYDIYVFGDEQGAYRVVFDVLNANSVDFLRTKVFLGMLESVTVGPAPEAATETTGATAMDAISDEDFALFQQVAQGATGQMTARMQEVCPDASSFPLAEPAYNANRPLDLSPFADALAAFDPARGEEIDALLVGASIPAIQALLDNGDLTSVELVTYYLDRIQRYDVDRLNSVIELNPQVLADAAAADAARGAGKLLGALHGIPVLFKDNIATGGGMHTTAGAYALKDWQPARDAFLVQQLSDAGALIFGKTNLSEWANYMDPCMPNGFSVVGGQTRNPYGPHETYGSSSGSGVAVGANLATVAVGSETSGSLIQPARVNSVVGLRPSQGLISRDYVVPLGPHLDTPGPMGRSVTDVAILLNALAGVDENDPKTADAAALADVDFTQYLSLDEARKVRVGVILPTQQLATFTDAIKASAAAQPGSGPTDEELQAILDAMVLPSIGGDPTPAIAALQAQGIEVVTIDDSTLPWPDMDTAWAQLSYDFKAGVADFFATVGEDAPVASLADVIAINNEDPANRAPYGQSYLEWSAANELTPEEFARVQATAAALGEAWMNTILEQNDVDILVTGMRYSGNAGAAGVPALTIPNGLDPNGRPQGIILSGPYLSDPQLIAVGYALEQALDGRVEPDLDATIAQIDAVTGK